MDVKAAVRANEANLRAYNKKMEENRERERKRLYELRSKIDGITDYNEKLVFLLKDHDCEVCCDSHHRRNAVMQPWACCMCCANMCTCFKVCPKRDNVDLECALNTQTMLEGQARDYVLNKKKGGGGAPNPEEDGMTDPLLKA